ncbi:hypothetical protein FJZ40_02205 [Candidatus Shapirobacteria bacterium]|nr:hypothetical protein [Candidatus Shapirobacteria bacterium]
MRRYTNAPSATVFDVTAGGSSWYFEGKITQGVKERLVVPAGVGLALFSDPSVRGLLKDLLPGTYILLDRVGSLYPVAATQWRREHYVLNETERATIDSSLKYFGFLPGEQKGYLMGEDSGNRLEWKSGRGIIPPLEIEGVNLVPIPPKWHEATIRKMYNEWIKAKNNE